MTRLPKLKISWRRGKQCTSPVTLGGSHKYSGFNKRRSYLYRFFFFDYIRLMIFFYSLVHFFLSWVHSAVVSLRRSLCGCHGQ